MTIDGTIETATEGRSDTMSVDVRREHAESVLANSRGNDWNGGHDADELATYRYAVVIERDSDGWVIGANHATDLAQIQLDCYAGTEGYDEWIDGVYDLNTGEAVEWSTTITIDALLGADEAGKVTM
jgi:hypothetical protein